ncbi:uncharacterized protein J4E84_009725 [Alternaria hordeiaustralica]|uniref:uncharacterized protein n=1 Tax=Alternaria hordeiaustralica TaxID=1187925 RepID=UPI0020C520C8|nr:uncharacterized protein J4E84_009725 [Alternaria hordeiaustralica]KAI4676108.1 hypothetical protein J4E84_009725 [Alternaria hordeiaustralica]
MQHHETEAKLTSPSDADMSPSTNMAALSCLPEELLDDITGYMKQRDLAHICLATHQLRRIANEKLYTNLTLNERYSGSYHCAVEQVFSFALALLHRPELASSVRKLSMSLIRGQPTSPPKWSSDDIAKALRVIDDMGTKGTGWAIRVPDWKARLLSGDGKACGGLILALLPNLVELEIEILATMPDFRVADDDVEYNERIVWSHQRYAEDPLDKLFGKPGYYLLEFLKPKRTDPIMSSRMKGFLNARIRNLVNRPALDLSQICGLKKLETLRFFGSRLDKQWCTLPKLQCLEVARECRVPASFVAPAVDTLQLELASCVAKEVDHNGALHAGFLSATSFPRLEHLSIQLTNFHSSGGFSIVKPILKDSKRAKSNRMVYCLSRVAPSLKTLSVSAYDSFDQEFLKWMGPVPTFTSFKQLETLTIPQDLLLGDGFPNPCKLLPASIQVIELLHPSVKAFAWLDALNKAHHFFQDLKAVYLIFENAQDDQCVAMYEKYSDWIAGRKMHYEVILQCPPAERAICDTVPEEENPRAYRIWARADERVVPSFDDEEAFPTLVPLTNDSEATHRRQASHTFRISYASCAKEWYQKIQVATPRTSKQVDNDLTV